MSNKFHHAVVLDLNFAGYGAVRSLAAYDIPVIGFIREQDKHIPEAHTKLCKKKIQFSTYEQLIQLLIALPEARTERPVLYLTSDAHVKFFLHYRNIIEEKFLINMPKNATIELLLNKNKFSEFALQHNISIPKSLQINGDSQLNQVMEQIRFPAIFKPNLRSQAWNKAKMPKAFLLHSIDDYKAAFEKSIRYEKNMILQEWIPGPDSNFFFCMVYYGNKGDCLCSFPVRKIRQWPVATGTASSAAPTDNVVVQKETCRIFNILRYKGFGAIEFKQSSVDNKYYLIEPSCRLDQTSYISTVNGVNIPLIAYNHLTCSAIPEKKNVGYPVIYIEESAELYSTLIYFKEKRITCRQWLKSLRGYRAYRYFNITDFSVFYILLWRKAIIIKQKLLSFFMKK